MMPFLTIFRALSPRGWLVAAGVVALGLLLAWCALDARQDAAEARRKAEASETLADARTQAGRDASAVRDRADERTSGIDATVKDGTDAIRNAPDRDAASRAALRSLCELNPGADPRCRVLNPDPGGVD